MKIKTTFMGLLLCAALFSNACSSGFVKQLSEIARLRQQLMDKYHEKDIGINLQNSAYLNITYINSSLNQQDSPRRAIRAQETARFVVANFPSIRQIRAIWIMFVTTETRLIVFHYSQSLDVFPFDNRGEAFSRGNEMDLAPSDDNPLTPIVRFNANRNETDISLLRIQLEGDMNKGLLLVPHFTAAGHAGNAGGNAVAPAFVVFDFASYSPQKVFAADSRLDIICDNQPAFSGKAHLLLPKDSGSEDGIAQFLTIQVPFAQFAKMGAARSLKLKINGRQFDLSPEAIAALRRMAAYVPPPPSARP